MFEDIELLYHEMSSWKSGSDLPRLEFRLEFNLERTQEDGPHDFVHSSR